MYKYINNYPSDRENGWSDELQGVTHDDDHWFFTQKGTLWKFPVEHDLKIRITHADPANGILKRAIPSQLAELRYNHFGDLCHFNGYLFIPITGPDRTPIIAAFKADDLSYIACKIMDGYVSVAWCAFNPNDELLYTSNKHLGAAEQDAVSPIKRYKIDMDKLVSLGRLVLTEQSPLVLTDEQGGDIQLKYMQGGAFDHQDHLHILNGYAENLDAKDGGISVFDTTTSKRIARSRNGKGDFNYQYKPQFPRYEEPEGLTYWDLDDHRAPKISGQLHAIMLDNDLKTDDFYFKHYKLK